MALDAPFAGYTLISRLSSVSDGIERWRAEGRAGAGEVYVGPRDLVLRATNLPGWGPFSRVETGARSDRWFAVVPGRIEENLEQLADRLTPGACLALAWHIAAALAEVHEQGGAHGALHPQHIGLDERGNLTIRPALGASLLADPDPDATAQATDCFQFAAILDTLDVAQAGDPALALLMNGLSRDRSRLRMQPGRAIRQTLTAILQRHPAWTDRLVEELGASWKPGPLPRAPVQDRPAAPRHPWRQSAAVAAVPVAAAVPAGDRTEEGPQPATINLSAPAQAVPEAAPASIAARVVASAAAPQIQLPSRSSAALPVHEGGAPAANEASDAPVEPEEHLDSELRERQADIEDTADVEETAHGVEDTAHDREDTAHDVEDTAHDREDTAHDVEDTAHGVEDTADDDTASGDEAGQDDRGDAVAPESAPDAGPAAAALAVAVPVQVMLDEEAPRPDSDGEEGPQADDDAPTLAVATADLPPGPAATEQDDEQRDEESDESDEESDESDEESDETSDESDEESDETSDESDVEDTGEVDEVEDTGEVDEVEDTGEVDEVEDTGEVEEDEDTDAEHAAEVNSEAPGETGLEAEPDPDPANDVPSSPEDETAAEDGAVETESDDAPPSVPLLVATPSIMPGAATPPAPPTAQRDPAPEPQPESPPSPRVAFDEPDEPSVRLAVSTSDAPRWQGVGGVTGDERREQELGAGKWNEPVEGNLDGLRKQVSGNPMREVEFEPTGPNWVALGGVAALVLLLGGWSIFASVGGQSDVPSAPAQATVSAAEGSTISLDGVGYGTAPAQVPVPADTAAHELCATPAGGSPQCATVRATDLAGGSYRLD